MLARLSVGASGHLGSCRVWLCLLPYAGKNSAGLIRAVVTAVGPYRATWSFRFVGMPVFRPPPGVGLLLRPAGTDVSPVHQLSPRDRAVRPGVPLICTDPCVRQHASTSLRRRWAARGWIRCYASPRPIHAPSTPLSLDFCCCAKGLVGPTRASPAGFGGAQKVSAGRGVVVKPGGSLHGLTTTLGPGQTAQPHRERQGWPCPMRTARPRHGTGSRAAVFVSTAGWCPVAPAA